jgi:K+-transporting ATPase KdpF subunit
MNSLLEYILVGIVTLAVLVYLVIALLAPERF